MKFFPIFAVNWANDNKPSYRLLNIPKGNQIKSPLDLLIDYLEQTVIRKPPITDYSR
jgi:hypothetical protein